MNPFLFPFLKTKEVKYYPSEGNVLFEDDFTDGLQGWTFLMEHNRPIIGPVWHSRLSHIGTGALLLQTGNVLNADASGAGIATAIKRLTQPRKKDGSIHPTVEFEAWFGWNANDQNNPRAIQFGIDTQLPYVTTHRNYYKIRYLNYDDNSTLADKRVHKFVLNTPNGYVDIPGADDFDYFNEAKAGFFHIRFRVNLVEQRYDKLWLNGKEFDISSFAAPEDVYVLNNGGTFDYGLNFSFDLLNRLNTASGEKRQARMYVPYTKAVLI